MHNERTRMQCNATNHLTRKDTRKSPKRHQEKPESTVAQVHLVHVYQSKTNNTSGCRLNISLQSIFQSTYIMVIPLLLIYMILSVSITSCLDSCVQDGYKLTTRFPSLFFSLSFTLTFNRVTGCYNICS